MKTSLFSLFFLWMVLNGSIAWAEIQSTQTGGLWNSSGTWIGGVIPGAGEDVRINGPVQVTFNSACNNIHIETTGSLFSYSSASWTLTVNGNIVNWGTISDNVPANTRLYINVYGSIENHGVWKNYGIYWYGTWDTSIGADQPFEVKQFHNNRTSGNILGYSSLTFNSTLINFNFNMLIFVYGYELHLLNSAELRDIDLYESAILYGDGTTLLYNVTGSFNSMYGEHRIGQGCSFNNLYNFGILQNYPTATATVTLSGQINNYGEIRDNPGFGNLIINFTGNLQNDGIWTNYSLNATGTTDQFINGTNPFMVDFFDNNNLTGNIITIGDVTFSGTNLRFYGRTLIGSYYNLTLLGPGSAHEVAFILGNGMISPDENFLFTYCTFDDATVNGTLNVGNQCVFTTSLVNNGTIRNREGNSQNTQFQCHVTNNGTIRNHPVSGTLTIDVSGSFLTNNGTWSNQQINLSGSEQQIIYASSPFTIPYFNSVKPTGLVQVWSDCEFSGTQINMNNDTLAFGWDVTLSLTNSAILQNAFVEVYHESSGIFMDGTGYLTNSTFVHPTFSGVVEITGNTQIVSGMVNNGILQNLQGENFTLPISGDLVNLGTIRNHANGGSLILEISGNLFHRGFVWDNAETRLTGTDPQLVRLLHFRTMLSPLTLNAMIAATTYQWYRDSNPIPNTSTLFSGTNTSVLSLNGDVNEVYYGAYQCITNNGDSRWINIDLEVTNIMLDLRVFLEGPFNGNGMNTDLNPVLPLSQPLGVIGYNGTESVDQIPDARVVDWIGLQIFDATDISQVGESTTIAGGAYFLLDDGRIVGLDGNSMPVLQGSINNNLFVAIWHRNHLPVVSYELTPDIYYPMYSYNFTTAASQAYGNNQSNLGNGWFGMIAGNADGDEKIDPQDATEWLPQAGKTGYYQGDVNMDRQVDNIDKNDIWYKNTGIDQVVPW